MQVASGVEPRIERVPQPPGEIRRNYASIARAHAKLGFDPQVDIQTRLRRAWELFLTLRECGDADPSSLRCR